MTHEETAANVHAAIIGGINAYRRSILEGIGHLPEDERAAAALMILREHVDTDDSVG